MRIGLAFLVVAAACGGKLADDGDGGSTDASSDGIVKKKDAAVSDGNVTEGGPPGGGINVSNGVDFEAEDQIAVAPDGTIAIMWQAFGGTPYIDMQYSFSTDDGKTFSAPKSVITPKPLSPGDPALTVDGNGNFYASYLGIDYTMGGVGYSRVFVASSPKGAMTFGTPVDLTPTNSTDLLDHPKVFATKAGTLLIGWADLPSITATTATGMVARSADQGATWTTTTLIGMPEATFGTFFWFCQGAGAVYTTFIEATQTSGFIGLRTTKDEGVTWSSSSTQVSLDTDQVAGLDPACAANGSDLWVMYATTQAPSGSDMTLDPADHIYVAHSADMGVTFDAARPDTMDHSTATMSTIPAFTMESSGKLDVAYVGGNSDGDTNGSVRFTRTLGMAVSPSVEIDGPMTFTLSRVSQAWVGDYFGIVARGTSLYAAYPNTASGQTHIYFRKMPLP